MRRPRPKAIAVDWIRKLEDKVAMIGGMRRSKIRRKLKQPTTTPISSAISRPGSIMASVVSMTLVATAPASVIVPISGSAPFSARHRVAFGRASRRLEATLAARGELASEATRASRQAALEVLQEEL